MIETPHRFQPSAGVAVSTSGDSPIVSPPTRTPILVISHERSGTHFLMNSLAACYGYLFTWTDFDVTRWPINFFDSRQVRQTLLGISPDRAETILKSHHQAGFFGNELADITSRYLVFYIYRDPVPVLLSFWRFMYRWPWREGPRTADPLTFAASPPCGNLMRYQAEQYPSMMARWAAHVDGWLDAAAVHRRIIPVRYEDLDSRFEETVFGFADALGMRPTGAIRPPRDFNIIEGGPADPTNLGRAPDVEGLRALCRANVGATMDRLGY